jgi:hypothetical protein
MNGGQIHNFVIPAKSTSLAFISSRHISKKRFIRRYHRITVKYLKIGLTGRRFDQYQGSTVYLVFNLP